MRPMPHRPGTVAQTLLWNGPLGGVAPLAFEYPKVSTSRRSSHCLDMSQMGGMRRGRRGLDALLGCLLACH